MKKLFLLSALLGVFAATVARGTPDPSTRTAAWRVIDTVAGSYRCDLACNANVADAARDTACIQAAITKSSATSANPWNACELPAGTCQISSSLSVTGASGFRLYGQGHDKTLLQWTGASAADPVLLVDDTTYSSFSDLTIKPGYAKTITVGIKVTNGAGAGAPSADRFENIFMDAASGKLVTGISIDNTGGGGDNNNEYHTLRNNTVLEYSGAAYKINGGQAKSQAFYDNTCLGSSRWTLDHSTVNTSTGVFTLDALAGTYLALNDGVVVYPRVQETFYGVLVDASTDTLTLGTNGLSVGDALALATLTGDTNLATGTIYWVQAIPSAGVIKLAATSGGGAIDITGMAGTAAIQAATLPGGMVDGTTYYVRSISGSNITLSATSGTQPQALFVPTSKGTGTFRIKPVAEKTRCLDNVAGSFRWQGGGGGYNSDYDFHIDNIGEASKIDGFNSEFSRKFLYKAGSYDVGGSSEIIPMTVAGIRWDSSGVNMAATGRAREVIATGHSGTLQVSSSAFGGHGAGEVRPLAFDLQRTNAFSIVFTSNDIGTPLSAITDIFPYGIPKLFGNLRWRHAEQSAVSLVDTRGAIDALDYGVVLDGLVGDDAAAMQLALDAVPAGGVLDLPCGTIRVDTGLTVTDPFDSITIQGCAPSTVTRDVFGAGAWNTPIDGTTLVTYMSSGTVLTIGNVSQGGKYTVRDIAIQAIGGTGKTTVGLSLVGSAGAAIADLSHVTVANMAVGIDCQTCEDGQFTGLALFGNDVGFYGDGPTNSNVFTAIDCGANNECGVLKGGLNLFVGGTVQGSVRYGFRVQGGENRFSDLYFEDSATVGAAISLEKATAWRLTDVSTGSGTLTFKGDALPALNTAVYIWCDGTGCALPTGIAASQTYTGATASAATDLITIGANSLAVGDAIVLSSVTGDTNLANGVTYWVQSIPTPNSTIKVTTSIGGAYLDITGISGTATLEAGKYYISAPSGATFKLAATSGGTAIVPSSVGSGILRVTPYAVEDGFSNRIDHIHAGTYGDISVWTGNNQLDLGDFHQSVKLRPRTNGNVVTGFPPACVDQGTSNMCLDFSSGFPAYTFSALSASLPGITMTGPAFLRLQMTTAAGLGLGIQVRDDLGYSRIVNSVTDASYVDFQPAGGTPQVVVGPRLILTGDTAHGMFSDNLHAWNGGSPSGTITVHDLASFSSGLDVQYIYPTSASDAYIELTGPNVIDFYGTDGFNFHDSIYVDNDVSATNVYPTGDVTTSAGEITAKGVKLSTLGTAVRDVKTSCGAYGDASHDDTAAIQACITATPSGGHIYFPKGKYLTSSPLTISAPISLIGDGEPATSGAYAYGSASWSGATMNGSVIYTAASSGNIITVNAFDPQLVTIENIGFWSTASGSPTTVGVSFTAGSGQARPRLSNVLFANLFTGLDCNSCVSGSIANTWSTGVRVGIALDSASVGNLISNTRSIGGTYAISDSGIATTIIGGRITSPGTAGIDIRGGKNPTIDGVFFVSGYNAVVIERSGGGATGSGGYGATLGMGNVYEGVNPVSVYTTGNTIYRNGEYACPAVTLQVGAANNYTFDTYDNPACTYTDSSGTTNNIRQYRGATGPVWSGTFGVSTLSASVAVYAPDAWLTNSHSSGYDQTDLIKEYNAGAGVKIDDSGGAGTTTKIKDGVIDLIQIDAIGDTSLVKMLVNTTDHEWETTSIDIGSSSYLSTDAIHSHTAAATVAFTTAGGISADKVTIGTVGGGNVSRVIYSQALGTGGITTGTGSYETIYSKVIPGGTLANNGDCLEIFADNNLASGVVSFRGQLGGSTFYEQAAQVTVSAYRYAVSICRTGAATGREFETLDYNNTATYSPVPGDFNLTWASNQTLEIAVKAAAGDGYAERIKVVYVPKVD